MTQASAYPEMLALASEWSDDTLTVQAGRPARVDGAATNPPLVLSTTYMHDTERAYGRDGNDGWGAIETAIGALEGGTAVAFASGLAAVNLVLDFVPAGGTVVLPSVAYYGVTNLFARAEANGRLTVRTVDAADTNAVIAAAAGADMVWLESIANPTMLVSDVPAIIEGARRNGAMTVVDSTFATPLRQKPLDLGADIVIHSASKLISGHNDVLMGIAICRSAERAQALATHRHDHGAVPGGLEAFLALRGLRTLALRLDKAEANAGELARRLSEHPHVTRVNYPGLPSSPQHELSARVLPKGCGNMLSFEVAGTAEQTDEILDGLRLLAHATSLGGVETLIERRTRWEPEVAAGVPMTLCRVSVGIENVDDLWADLDASIRRVLG
ncbi:MAG: trans-sulfuration enzyme family protein [Gulosibacter sp.]|uniref:trans-sulfuration enzyme family protein n=1 Tax=Gulosibacter sp. TaxID=2817531 RepID=UPI003F8FF054